MQPFLRLIAARPQLLTDHVQAYADLMAADFGDASAAFTRRVILGGAALMGALVTTLLSILYIDQQRGNSAASTP